MKQGRKQRYYLISFILLSNIFANNVFAKPTLKVAFGNSLPPWVLSEENRGILLDLAKISFENTNYQMHPVYYPYARRIKAYKNDLVDVVTDITPQVVAQENLEGYLSESFYFYENVAVSLATKRYEINSVADLTSLRVLAWQGAMKTLGREYAHMATQNADYKETYKQKSQIEMLFRDRVDVIQIDTKIFYFYRQKVAKEGKIKTDLAVTYSPIFGRNHCAFLFRDKTARDEFNEQIVALQKDKKQYNRIYHRYIGDVDVKNSR